VVTTHAGVTVLEGEPFALLCELMGAAAARAGGSNLRPEPSTPLRVSVLGLPAAPPL
jgi:hypothetical protein